MSFVCHSYVLVSHLYFIPMCHMSFVFHSYVPYVTRMSSVFYSYALVCHPYVNCMYSYAILLSLVCTCMPFVCQSYVLLVYHSNVTRMHSYVIRMSSYVLVCHLYVTHLWYYHEPEISNNKRSLLDQNDATIVKTCLFGLNGLNDKEDVLINASIIEYITTKCFMA